MLMQESPFGVDWDGPLPEVGDDDSGVVVDPPQSLLSQQELMELADYVNPTEPCQDYGLNLYMDCLDFVSRL